MTTSVSPAGSPRSRGTCFLVGGFRARFTSTWERTGRVEVCEPPQRLIVVTSQTGETGAID